MSSSNTVTWGDSHQYDTASTASVACYDNIAVEVHTAEFVDSHTDQSAFWCKVGTVSPDSNTIAWGDSHHYDNGGMVPRVALYGTIAVEVHQGDDHNVALWYRVGTVAPDSHTIAWGDSYQYDNGSDPSVALHGNTAVEVHMGAQSDSSALWYRVGTVAPDSHTIAWGDSHHYDNGSDPSVALHGNTAVEVHMGAQSDSGRRGEYTLWYRVGTVAPDSHTIAWGDSHHYDNGAYASVGLCGDIALEIHSAAAVTVETLSSCVGTVDRNAKTIGWGPSHPFDGGALPSIASSTNGHVIEVHEAR